MTVGALAAHLGRQVHRVPLVLAAPVPDDEPPVTVDEHYARSAWVGRAADDPVNVAIARDSREDAEAGPDEVLARAAAALAALRTDLPAQPAGLVVRPPWTDWSLTLDDFLLTRLLEIAVHTDDLAVSVGTPPPALPDEVTAPVLALLTRLAARRHGVTSVLRALSRAERAQGSISAL
jgi:hypothetical protein